MADRKLRLLRFNPSVPSHWLLLIAGALWTLGGGMLCYRAYRWLEAWHTPWAYADGALGVVLAVTAYSLAFASIARKNIDRISRLPERACVFAFTAWKGYLIIAVMMTSGMVLRSMSVPGQWLALAYATMGGALLMASAQFYLSFWKTTLQRNE